MTEPRRWIDEGATALEGELLRLGRQMDPPEQADGQVWAAIVSRVGGTGSGPGAGGGAAGGGASAAAAGSSIAPAAGGLGVVGMIKWTIVGAVSAGALLGARHVVAPPRPVDTPAASVASVQPSVSGGPTGAQAAPAAVASTNPPLADRPLASLPASAAIASRPASAPVSREVQAEREPEDRPPLPIAVTPSSASQGADPESAPALVTAQERLSRLREESQMLGQARSALQQGDSAGALSMLEQARRRFGAGGLEQEREALVIEALSRAGQGSAASQRASAFLQAWPSSPLADRVRGFVH
jgi:hypothetical protein